MTLPCSPATDCMYSLMLDPAILGVMRCCPLQVAQADAAAVRSVIVRAAGAPSRGVIRHLDAVVNAVRTGGIQVPLE